MNHLDFSNFPNDENLYFENLKESIPVRIMKLRDGHYHMLKNRFTEILITMITYNELPLSINKIALEYALMQNYSVAIGVNVFGKLCVLGYVPQKNYNNSNLGFFNQRRMQKQDIVFTLPKNLRCEKYDEIWEMDDCATGNFVVVNNRTFVNNYSDLRMIEHYCTQLAEIMASRFSLNIQAKCLTYFKSLDPLNETTDKVIDKFFNGASVIAVSDSFDIDDFVGYIEGAGLASQNMEMLKDEYNNLLSELCNFLGINSLGVDKQSGVSAGEVEANTSFVIANENIKLANRKLAFDKLNKRFGYNIEAKYDNNVEPELRILRRGETEISGSDSEIGGND